MDINKLLSGGKCACGKIHSCDIKYVYIERDAYKRFEKICGDYRKILLVADENTFKAAGEQVERALCGKDVRRVIFPGDTILIPDERAVSEVEKNLDGIDFIIAIGSGVLQDICKFASHEKNIPYAVAATAPSMDGYASSGAAMIYKGMKVTFPAGVPVAIVADTQVLKNAPEEMIKAGYGDIIGKYSALNDWKLSREVNNEYFCGYIYDMTYKMIEKTLSLTDGILSGNEESIGVLMEALVVVGILMSFAGSSRPASGSEHHLSHFFEITGILGKQDYLPHGIDVAYSTYITAKIREKILSGSFKSDPYCTCMPEEEIRKMYGSISEECISLQKKTGNYAKDRCVIYKEKESLIREILGEMPSSEKIKEILEKAELYIDDFYKMYGAQRIKNAVKYAKDLKDRYTVLWMNYDLYGGEFDE